MALARVVDFETSGLPPTGRVCEVGWADVTTGDGAPAVGLPAAMLVDPGHAIPPEVRAVHHISDFDLAGAPPIAAGFMKLTAGRPDVFVAHNAKFEREFFTGGGIPWICTRKVGMRLWPEAPNFQNQTLRYYLDVNADDEIASPPHRAGPDAYVTALIFAEAVKLATIEQMIAWTDSPSLLPGKINFGKHKGTAWAEVDRGYLRWIGAQADMDEDVKFTARHHLEGGNAKGGF